MHLRACWHSLLLHCALPVAFLSTFSFPLLSFFVLMCLLQAACSLSLSFWQSFCCLTDMASINGQGGPFPGFDAWLCVVRSKWRTTFSPSNLTSMDQALKYTFPLI